MDDLFEETTAELAASPKRESSSDHEGQLTVDIFQDEDHIIVQSTIAGVKPEDMDIAITNDMVTIKGHRVPDQKIRSADYFYQELYWGAFSRSIILPVDIDADNAKASMKNGILTIKLPKLEKLKTKRIKISE